MWRIYSNPDPHGAVKVKENVKVKVKVIFNVKVKV
jgi:hypothetical protein